VTATPVTRVPQESYIVAFNFGLGCIGCGESLLLSLSRFSDDPRSGLIQVRALARVCVELSLNVPYSLDGIKYDRFELVVAGFADAQNYGCLAVHDSEFSSCHASSLPRSFMGNLGNCAFDQPQLEAVNSRNEAKRQSQS
jgi:hypothetical protein